MLHQPSSTVAEYKNKAHALHISCISITLITTHRRFYGTCPAIPGRVGTRYPSSNKQDPHSYPPEPLQISSKFVSYTVEWVGSGFSFLQVNGDTPYTSIHDESGFCC